MQGSSLGFQLFTVSRFGFLLLVSIFLARRFPDQIIVEQYELLLLVGGSFTFFWVSGLFDGFVVLFRNADTDKQNGVLLHTFVAAMSFSALSSLGSWVVGQYFLHDKLPGMLPGAFALFLFFDMNSLLLAYYFLVKRQNIALMLYGVIIYLLYFLFLVVPLYNGYSLEVCIWLMAGFAALKFFLMLLLTGRELAGAKFEAKHWKALLRVSGPLILAVLLSQSAQYVDSYLVESYFPYEFTVFRYGAKELPLVLLLANALSLVRSGDIAQGLRSGDVEGALTQLKTSSRKLMYGAFLVSIVLLAVSELLFGKLLGPGFLPAVPVFDLYLLLVIPRLLFPQSVIRGYQKTLAMTFSAAVELILNIGLSLILMQDYGIKGIAMATVIAFFVEKVILVIYCHRNLNVKIGSYTRVLEWFLCASLLVVLVALKYLL